MPTPTPTNLPALLLDADAAYAALVTRDARFDGRLFVGVTSTGVYCRPVCRVRTPRRENCRFFETCAQAEAQAFRPCLKCRPEIAPGLSHTDSSRSLADTAARWLEHAVHSGGDTALPALASRLGVTDRHLRRIFQAAHGVSPRDFLATQRLLLAKQLLTDTQQPITQVALASGFGSLRRFNAAFAERYRLAPGQLRRNGGAADQPPTLRLAFRAPYDVPAVLGFFARRQVQGVEQVDGLTMRRTLAVAHRGHTLRGWLQARFVPERSEVWLTLAPTLAPALGSLLHRVRDWLDLDADPAPIDAALASLPLAGAVAGPLSAHAGTRVCGTLDGFELAVRVILGQQVTVKAASTLVQRLVDTLGEPVETPYTGLNRLFPTAQTLAAADPETIGRLGIVRQRVGALQALARAVCAGTLTLHPTAPLAATMDTLRALPGVGEWTTQLIALRALRWPDAWPATDVGLYKALGTRDARNLTAQAEAWRPWRAYALMRLWHHVENSPCIRP